MAMSGKKGSRGAKKGAAARRAGFRLVTGEEPAGVVGLEARIRIPEGELADEQRTAEEFRQQLNDYRAGQEALRQDLERVMGERDKARADAETAVAETNNTERRRHESAMEAKRYKRLYYHACERADMAEFFIEDENKESEA